eukprot:g13210.t1
MPKGWAKKCTFGVIAQMSDTTNNHDLLGLHVDTDANDEDEDGLCAVVPCTNGGARAMLGSREPMRGYRPLLSRLWAGCGLSEQPTWES